MICMIRVPGHVLNVAVPAYAGVEKHGDGGPGGVQKAALNCRTSGPGFGRHALDERTAGHLSIRSGAAKQTDFVAQKVYKSRACWARASAS